MWSRRSIPFILAEVPIKDAGSASGVVNAIQQVGGAVGVAVVGVIFFGLLGSGARTSVESVRTELSADLSGAGVPQQMQAPILDNFQTCFHDRSNAKDFSAGWKAAKRASLRCSNSPRCSQVRQARSAMR